MTPALSDVFGDTQFAYGARGVARAISRKHEERVSLRFPPRQRRSDDDTPYEFGTLPADASAADKCVSDVQMRAWTNFARTGNPNGPGVPDWPPFDEHQDNYLNITDPVAVSSHWRTKHLDFVGRYLAARSIQP